MRHPEPHIFHLTPETLGDWCAQRKWPKFRAKQILEERREEWERLAQGLLEYETLTGDEIKRVMAGEPPHLDENDDHGAAAKEEETSVLAIPKTKPRKKPAGEGGLEPEPMA